MKNLIKYLKKYWGYVAFIVAFLFLQAYLDLSLPQYTSNIVNVGIQQGGIDEKVPEVLSDASWQYLQLFLNEEEKEKILSFYELKEKENLSSNEYENLIKKYPLLKTNNLYILNTKDTSKIEEILSLPMFYVSIFSNESEEVKELKNQLLPLFNKDLGFNEETSMLTLLAALKEEQFHKVLEPFKEQIQILPDSIFSQISILYIKTEYQLIGMNMETIQANYILLSGLKMLGVALLSMISSIVVGLLGAKTAASLGKDLRSQVFRKVISFSNVEFKEYSTASLITRSTNDIQQVQTFIVLLLRTVFYAPIIGIGGIIKVLNTNSNMTWIVGVALASILLLVISLFVIVMPKFKVIQKLIDKLNLVTREILTGIPVIRAFNTYRHEENRFDKANIDLMKTNLFVNRVMAFMMPAMMFIMNSIALLIIWHGAKGIDAGTLQVGDMMALIQYTMQIIMAFLMISMFSIILPRAAVSLKRIDEVLNTRLKIIDPVIPKKFDKTKKGTVEFKNVSFRYPDAEKDVISNISFIAKPGETTAFIGSTGSGKSTLINLIPRFFDVTEGAIYVDGVNIKDVTMHDLRSKIGYIPQKGILFSGTIASNISYGVDKLSKKEIHRALSIAQASEFVDNLKEKENYPIAQGGTNVSGGQKQRLSIARAVATNPEIYIFDDSFSALDFKTDAALRARLHKETAGSTVLIVAQRISTIMNADQIVVLNEGTVVGIGKHEELIKTCPIYKEIAESQLGKEELENA